MKAAEQANFIYAAAIDSFSFKHECKSEALPFSYIAMGRVLYTVCQFQHSGSRHLMGTSTEFIS